METRPETNQQRKHLLADLKSIPVRVPAATVLMSSSAPLAFSITTPNTLYNKAAEAKKHTAQLCSDDLVTIQQITIFYKRGTRSLHINLWDLNLL